MKTGAGAFGARALSQRRHQRHSEQQLKCQAHAFPRRVVIFAHAGSCGARSIGGGRVTLLIDGDDGTNLTRQEIAAALRHPGYSGRAA